MKLAELCSLSILLCVLFQLYVDFLYQKLTEDMMYVSPRSTVFARMRNFKRETNRSMFSWQITKQVFLGRKLSRIR